MNCKDTQKMIMPFVNKDIDNGEMAQFLDHIKTCPICMEELEVYYTLITSMRQLDDEEELSDNYKRDLLDLLERSEEKIRNKNRLYISKKVVLLSIVIIISMTSTYHLGERVIEDIIHRATVSDFMPESLSLLDSRDIGVDIKDQSSDIYLYLRQHDKKGADKMYEYYNKTLWNNMIIQKEFGENTSIPNWIVVNY